MKCLTEMGKLLELLLLCIIKVSLLKFMLNNVTIIKYNDIYRESKKTRHYTPVHSFANQILTDFQNSFTIRLRNKLIIKLSLKIPPHLKRVATLPCEI